MPALIRPERPSDFDEIRRLLEAAFAPSTVEAPLVDALRAERAGVPELCLVADEEGAIAGHIFYSRATLDSGHEVLALAPMAVVPARQRAGIGSRLLEESLGRARKTDYPLIVVVGHPDYYSRLDSSLPTDTGSTRRGTRRRRPGCCYRCPSARARRADA